MGKRERVAVMVAVFLGLALVGAGAVRAAAGPGAEEPTESTIATEITSPADTPEAIETTSPTDSTDATETTADTPEATETTSPTEGSESEDSLLDPDPTTEGEPFGHTISSLRHEGDHRPAAVVMGKTVPGWEKHAATTTTTTAGTTPDSATDDASEDDGDADVEVETASLTGKSGHKPSKPAAASKGKAKPGRSK